MSAEDKARYGRVCLLVLNVCPVSLRRVIEHYFTTHGFKVFHTLLDQQNNKHLLFHLRFQKCCLVHCTSRSTTTTLRSQQWDLLYRETSKNPHGDRGKCPCMYTAIPGVTTDAMDVTLCCLLLRNICPGVNISYIEDICTVRNQLLHASSAALGKKSFRQAWIKVETAILSLAKTISVSFHTEMSTSVQETKSGFCDLGNLESVLTNERRLDSLEETQEKEAGKNEEREKRMQTLEEEHIKTKTKMREVKFENRSMFSRIEKIEIDNSSTREKMTKLEADNMNKNEKIFSLEVNSSCTNQKVSDLETETSNMSHRMTTMATENSSTKQRVTTLEMKETDTKQRVDHIERVIANRHQKLKTESDQIEKEDARKEKVLGALLKINNRSTEKIQFLPLQETYKNFDQIYASPVICIRVDLEYEMNERSRRNDEKFFSDLERKGVNISSPHDMFYKNEEHVRYIFVQGEAGHGKTVYCQNLVRHWCKAKEAGRDKGGLSEWERSLDEFDFVFMIMLRHVQKSRISLLDMICYDLFRHFDSICGDIKHVISSEKYRCLIIIDGLDEWKISPEVKEELVNEALPNINGTSSCTFLFTYRPWKHAEIAGEIESCDRVIQIHGFDHNGMESAIKNVLETFNKKDSGRKAIEKKRDAIISMSQRSGLAQILKIPILVASSVVLYQNGKFDKNGMTCFYLALVKLLIKRANVKKTLDQSIKLILSERNTKIEYIPYILKSSRHKVFLKFLSVLTKLGDIAYKDLMSTETCLVFSKEELEESLGTAELEFALQVGLLTQCEASGCFDEENVSVNFFHKTIQEFLAAVHVVCGGEVSVQTFCDQLSSVKVILDYSNVVSFVSGLSPSFGCAISSHIVHVSNQDEHILKWRETFDSGKYVFPLFNLQGICYKEIKHNHMEQNALLKSCLSRQESTAENFDIQNICFHVANIILRVGSLFSQKEILNMIQDPLVDIIALSVYACSNFNSFCHEVLSEFFLRTKSLQYLHIHGSHQNEGLFRGIRECVGLRVVNLEYVELAQEFMHELVLSIKSSRQLQTLKLHHTDFYQNMKATSLKEVKLESKTAEELKKITPHAPNQHEKFELLEDLLWTLPDCPHLSTLHIDCESLNGALNEDALVKVLPCLNDLVDVKFGSSYPLNNTCHNAVLEGISELPKLRYLHLEHTDLNERFTDVISKKSILQRLELNNLKIENKCMYHISQMSQLQYLKLYGITIVDADCDVMLKLPMLRELRLHEFNGKVSLQLMSECKQIEMIYFWSVKLPMSGWMKFTDSLLKLDHKVFVELIHVNIDGLSVGMITECPHIRVVDYTPLHGNDALRKTFRFYFILNVANDANQ